MKGKNDTKRIARNFGLSSLSVNNKSTVYVLTFIITIMGLISYNSMPKESFPEIVIPEIYIGTSYRGNSPIDIENLVTRPIEKELNTVSGIDKILSTSIQDYSTIIAKFNTDISVEEALRKVKDAVDKSKKELPTDLDQEPNIFELNFSEFPIMNINLSGDFSMEKLKDYAETLEDKIEKLPEISKVDIRGSMDKEVKIDVDIHKMEALKISFNNIAGAISAENQTISGGNIKTDNLERNIRIIGEYTNLEQIKSTIIKHEKGNIVYLENIADITFDYEERKSYARQNTQPVVMLDIVKRSGTNLLDASDKIKEIVKTSQTAILPENLEISITNDQSDQTRSQLNNLENSIIFGVILVVLVLLFFLGLRNALFVGIAIPLSMFMAFMVLGATGVSLNMMVLFALILSLGMLVDNGIVVVENIYRLMDEGLPPIKAAKEGVGEVALPVITSTATTLSAFLPLAFWPGMIGEFMQYLPLTLMIVLGSSLIVALVINPVLTATFMQVEDKGINTKRINRNSMIALVSGIAFLLLGKYTIGNLLVVAALIMQVNAKYLFPATRWFQQKAMPMLEEKYRRFLTFALTGKRALIFFLGAVGLLLFSFVLMGVFTPNVEFFPINQPHYVNVFIEKPIGTDIHTTNKLTKKIETIVIGVLDQFNDTTITNTDTATSNFFTKSVIAQVGEGTSDPKQGASFGVTPHKARITANFVDFEYRRGVNSTDVMEEIRAAIKGFPGVYISVDKDQQGPPLQKPISIEIIGQKYEDLVKTSREIKNFINETNIAGIEDLKSDLELGKPELTIEVDRVKARRYGISTGQIASSIRTALFGMEVSKYKQDEDDYPIQLRLDEKYRNDPEVLLNQRVTFRDQSNGRIKQVPISVLTKSINSSTYGSIKRKNLDRVATLSSNVLNGYNADKIVAELKEAIKDYAVPNGITIKFAGQQEDQQKEMAFLSTALMVAVFLIFLIIVAQFNSVGTPFIIITAVVLSIIGVLLGLIIFQMDFIIIMTMIGIISLAGVVVNNVIVLIDYTNLLMKRREKELNLGYKERLPLKEVMICIVKGGQYRLRPVLLTAITTVLGLLPLATGMNINFFTLFSNYDPQFFFGGDNLVFWGPMSWTVIFGLTFATFLTLIVVPAMYYLLNQLKYKIYSNTAQNLAK